MSDRGPLRILLSFAFYESLDFERLKSELTEDGTPPCLMADSGAYSADTAGHKVSIADYAAWLREHDEFDMAVNLDVIGDEEATWRNHQVLEQLLGRRVMPVVHYGGTVEHAQAYFDDGHTLIALGGIASGRRTFIGQRYRWMHQFFSWAKETGVVFHGLGVGSLEHIFDWPWFSVDTANPTRLGQRFGRSYVFDRARGKMIGTYTREHNAHHDRVAGILRRRGVDPAKLDTVAWNPRWAEAVSADSYRQVESWVRKRREPVCWGELEGLRVYICGGVGEIPTTMVGRISEEETWQPTVSPW